MDLTIGVQLHTDPLLLHKTSMRHRSFSERLLGIYTTKTLQSPSASLCRDDEMQCLHEKLDQLWIRGLVQDGPASKSGNICIGDCLLTVEGYVISSVNVEGILANLTGVRKIIVTLSRPYNQPIVMSNSVLMTNPLVRNIWRPLPAVSQHISVMYRDASWGDRSNIKESICYKYHCDSTDLLNLSGVYVNLMRSARDISDSDTNFCRTIIRSEHSTYRIDTNQLPTGDLFILAMPQLSCSPQQDTVSSEILRVSRFCYGSTRAAFLSDKHHADLDRMFLLLSKQIVETASKTVVDHTWSPNYSVIRSVDFKYDDKVYIDCCITDLEATNIQQMLDYPADMTRTYSVIGSAMFFKESLICSHLLPDLLLDLYTYLQYFGVFTMANVNPWQQLVFWRRIYPSVDRLKAFSPLTRDSRCYALTVTMDTMLLCLLLESDDASACRDDPDEFYTQQALLTLHQIQSLGLICRLDLSLETQHTPLIQDNLYEKVEKVQRYQTKSWFKGRRSSLTSLPSSLRSLRNNELNKVASLQPLQELLIATRSSSDSFNPSLPLSASFEKLHSHTVAPNEHLPYLIHCVQLDITEGILIETNSGDRRCDFHHIVTNFNETVHEIMRRFGQIKSQKFGYDAMILNTDVSEGNIVEYGSMFVCPAENGLKLTHKESPVQFWVVGRRMLDPYPREVYVCFPDGIPETAVEGVLNTIH